jgi:ParB family chromosome partitioning protein
MSKIFTPRVSKKDREKLDLAGSLNSHLFSKTDQKLLEGARLQNVKLSEISVRKQVRTYFNDDSIKELAENIKLNGLIQPLVIHREGNQFVLICGERRFRAMGLITEMLEAPCFILEDKTSEELMAIQFSENSARENLHYIDVANSILDYQLTTNASERTIMAALGVSKTEVHRSLLIAKLPTELKEAAKKYAIEKYVLLEWDKIPTGKTKASLLKKILSGELTKRAQLQAESSAAVQPASPPQRVPTQDLLLPLV